MSFLPRKCVLMVCSVVNRFICVLLGPAAVVSTQFSVNFPFRSSNFTVKQTWKGVIIWELNVFPSECVCAATRMRMKDISLFLGMWNKSNTSQYEWDGVVFPFYEFSKNVYLQSQSLMLITMVSYSYSDFYTPMGLI